MNRRIKLAPPWITYYNEIKALFKYDHEVKTEYDDEEYTIKVYVNNADKADALTKLLPGEKVFGNITVKTIVVPANVKDEPIDALFRRAFKGNPAVDEVVLVDDIYKINACYVVMSAMPVQFYDDNIADVNGNRTILYQDVARDVFGDHFAVFFCTEAIQ